MTTTTPTLRLRKDDRVAIQKAIIDHRFKEERAALAETEAALALEAYNQHYDPKVREWLDAAPAGGCVHHRNIEVNALGLTATLKLADMKPRTNQDAWYLRVNLKPELGERARDFVMLRREHEKAIAGLEREVDTMLARYSTFKAVREGWPDAKVFIDAVEKDRIAALPPKPEALPVPVSLNDRLGLPPVAQVA